MTRLFRVSIPTSVLVLVVLDALLVAGCYVLAARWFTNYPETFLLYDDGWLEITLVVIVIQMGLYFDDLYEHFVSQSRILLVQQLCLILGVSFLLQAILGYFRSPLQLPKWTMVFGSLLVLALFPPWRIAFHAMVRKAIPKQKLLFLGASPIVREIAARLTERPETGWSIIGYLGDRPASPPLEDWVGVPLLGGIGDLDQVVRSQTPVRLVVGMKDDRNQLPVQRLLDFRFSGMIELEEAATMYETVFARVSVKDLRPSQLLFSADLGPRRMSMTLQNIYSSVIALIGILVTLPIMALVALLVRISSPGPILFRQNRVGLNGRHFMLFKFRSMYNDAEARTGAQWATKNDPRVTPIGRWLRKLRLDELPQLFNVLRGDMSIVGPRPERPEFAEKLDEQIPYFRHRHCVKPGITGWAQINYKYPETIEEATIKLEYDLYYIKNLSPALDAYIIFHTLKVMLLSRGGQ